MFTLFREYHEKDRIDYSLHRTTLFFRDSAAEKRFQQTYFLNNLQVGRACHLIAVFFYGMYALWDTLAIEPSRMTLWIWLFSSVTLIFLAGLAASFFAREFYARYWQALYAFYVLITPSDSPLSRPSPAPIILFSISSASPSA